MKNEYFIEEGKAIFLKDLSKEDNVLALFKKDFQFINPGVRVFIQITARTFYRLYINNQLIMQGPARSAHKYLRVDNIDITDHLIDGNNELKVYVKSYFKSFKGYSNEFTLEPGILQLAIRARQDIVLRSDSSFQGYLMIKKHKAGRISHCRSEAEIYTLDGKEFQEHPVETLEANAKYLERGMLYPTLDEITDPLLVEYGSFVCDKEIKVKPEFYEHMYEEEYKNIDSRPDRDQRQFKALPLKDTTFKKLDQNSFLLFDFLESHVGFISFDLEIVRRQGQRAVCDIHHSEAYTIDGELAIHTAGAIRLYLEKDIISFTSLEPYLLRYLRLTFKGIKELTIKNIKIISYYYPDQKLGSFTCNDEGLNRLYLASRKTLLLNTLDIFMDCPERERGGWLCDSFWSARAANLMLGDTLVEKAFIENFLHTEGMHFDFFPEVYPANKANYGQSTGITTWSFWLMLELCDYVKRTNGMDFASKYKERVYAFIEGSKNYLDKVTGLLYNMPNVFIDWSDSNLYTRPYSLPANSLYAYMLIELGKLYEDKGLIEEGKKIRKTLQDIVYDLEYLPDSFDYQDGRFITSQKKTEANHYTSLWAELFERDEIKDLAFKVIHTMGYSPTYPNNPNIGLAGLFIGLCIRLDLLAKWDEKEKMLEDIKGIFYPQLREGPGTLWENSYIESSSRCHGFTSYVGVHLTRDILGLGIPNERDKTIEISPNPCGLRWARGTCMTQKGLVSLSWKIVGNRFILRASCPEEYRLVYRFPKELDAYDKEIL